MGKKRKQEVAEAEDEHAADSQPKTGRGCHGLSMCGEGSRDVAGLLLMEFSYHNPQTIFFGIYPYYGNVV